MLGSEINPFAAELARVSVWIGEINWMREHGFDASRNPILKPLQTIECRDGVLNQVFELFEVERNSLVPPSGSVRRLPCDDCCGCRHASCTVLLDYDAIGIGAHVDGTADGLRHDGVTCPIEAHRRRRTSPPLRRQPSDLRSLGLCPMLACKLGALRKGPPFKDWVLPSSLSPDQPRDRARSRCRDQSSSMPGSWCLACSASPQACLSAD